VRIGPHAFVGANCVILKNTTIGEDAVVGAGSVVTRDVPAGEIWAGAPAKFIRKV
jgi:acetyltransferase-like isoleucine patch superfamily enzyme